MTATSPTCHEGLRVLAVDDLAFNRTLLSLALVDFGFSVVTVSDGAGALAALADNGFDAVLMDLEMPVMGGLEAVRRIRAGERSGGRMPIIAITASRSPADRAACEAAGFDHVIVKPADPGQIALTILELRRSQAGR